MTEFTLSKKVNSLNDLNREISTNLTDEYLELFNSMIHSGDTIEELIEGFISFSADGDYELKDCYYVVQISSGSFFFEKIEFLPDEIINTLYNMELMMNAEEE